MRIAAYLTVFSVCFALGIAAGVAGGPREQDRQVPVAPDKSVIDKEGWAAPNPPLVPIKEPVPEGGPPLFATAKASEGRSRDFGLDGPHVLAFVSLQVPHVKWKNKAKTRDWPFDQPDFANESAVTIYLGGPHWHREKQSRVVTVDTVEVSREAILKRLKEPTPVLISVSGKMVDPYYLKVVKPDTLIVILGPRDLELSPVMERGLDRTDANTKDGR